jgi:hypothetical protein
VKFLDLFIEHTYSSEVCQRELNRKISSAPQDIHSEKMSRLQTLKRKRKRCYFLRKPLRVILLLTASVVLILTFGFEEETTQEEGSLGTTRSSSGDEIRDTTAAAGGTPLEVRDNADTKFEFIRERNLENVGVPNGGSWSKYGYNVDSTVKDAMEELAEEGRRFPTTGPLYCVVSHMNNRDWRTIEPTTEGGNLFTGIDLSDRNLPDFYPSHQILFGSCSEYCDIFCTNNETYNWGHCAKDQHSNSICCLNFKPGSKEKLKLSGLKIKDPCTPYDYCCPPNSACVDNDREPMANGVCGYRCADSCNTQEDCCQGWWCENENEVESGNGWCVRVSRSGQ